MAVAGVPERDAPENGGRQGGTAAKPAQTVEEELAHVRAEIRRLSGELDALQHIDHDLTQLKRRFRHLQSVVKHPAAAGEMEECSVPETVLKADSTTTVRSVTVRSTITVRSSVGHHNRYQSSRSVIKRALTRRQSQLVSSTELVQLTPSIWDASLLIASNYTDGVLVSATLVILLLVNILMQVTFLYILAESGLTTSQIDNQTVAQYEDWRTYVAHEYSHFDKRHQLSLTARLCQGDDGLPSSSLQFLAYQSLTSYMGTDGDGGLTDVGPLMSILAQAMWLLAVAKEMKAVLNLGIAFWHLPRRGYTHFKLTSRSEGDEAMEIASVSWSRLVMANILLIVRFGVACTLCVYGCLYLVHTTSVSDLLLNALALDLVLSIDELLFEVLAPVRVVRLIEATRPLYIRDVRNWHGIDWKTPMYVFGVLGAVILLADAYVKPQIRVLVRARDALCGGDIDFVTIKDELGIVMWSYPESSDTSWLRPRNFDGGSPIQTYGAGEKVAESFTGAAIQVLLQQQGRDAWDKCGFDECYYRSNNPYSLNFFTLNLSGPDCCVANALKAPMAVLQTTSRATLTDATRFWNRGCVDILEGELVQYAPTILQGRAGEVINQFLGNPCSCPVTHPVCRDGTCHRVACSDIIPFCNDPTEVGVVARSLCSKSCGCTDPRSSLVTECEEMCTRSGPFLAILQAMPCEDVPADDPAFVKFLDGLESLTGQMLSALGSPVLQQVTALRQVGCKLLNNLTNEELTDAGGWPPYLYGFNPCWGRLTWAPYTKPLAYFCPASCGCRQGDPYCPGTCPRREATDATCIDAQRADSVTGGPHFTSLSSDLPGPCPAASWGAQSYRIS